MQAGENKRSHGIREGLGLCPVCLGRDVGLDAELKPNVEHQQMLLQFEINLNILGFPQRLHCPASSTLIVPRLLEVQAEEKFCIAPFVLAENSLLKTDEIILKKLKQNLLARLTG